MSRKASAKPAPPPMSDPAPGGWTRPRPRPTSNRLLLPVDIIGTWLPMTDEIPREFFDERDTNRWTKLASDWFMEGLKGVRFVPKEGICLDDAIRHLKMVLGSWEPQHEHKIAGVGWLMSLWFEDCQRPDTKQGK